MSVIWSATIDPVTGDATGENQIIGSRLVSKDFLSTSSGPAQLTSAIRSIIANPPAEWVRSHVMGGGKSFPTALSLTVLSIPYGDEQPPTLFLPETTLMELRWQRLKRSTEVDDTGGTGSKGSRT